MTFAKSSVWLLVSLSLPLPAVGQRTSPGELVDQLLSRRAPAPNPGLIQSSKPLLAGERWSLFEKPDNKAPLEVLAKYWAENNEGDPDSVTRLRLVEASQKFPQLIPRLSKLLPATPAAHEVILKIYEQEVRTKRFRNAWRDEVSKFLRQNTMYLRRELLQKAGSATDKEGYIDGEEDLRALAKLDWPLASEVLKKHAAKSGTRIGALALGLMYRRSLVENDDDAAALYRSKLKSTAEDKKQPGKARAIACEELLDTDWPGRDEWYLNLFQDQTLSDLSDGHTLFSPLSSPVWEKPDDWIPRISRLVGDSNRVVHNAAVQILVSFHLRNGRKDALLPLLPWLFDPKWSSARDRLRLIQSTDELDMKESVPGLIAVLDQDDQYERSYAAASLVHFQPPEAVPALKRAIEKEREWDHRRRIIQALVACSGISGEEAEAAILAYAQEMKTPEGKERIEKYAASVGSEGNVPASLALGIYLSDSKDLNEDAVGMLIARASTPAADRETTQILLNIVDSQPSAAAHHSFLARLQSERVSGESVHIVLTNRESLVHKVAGELRTVAGGRGAPAAVATVLLKDNARASHILKDHDMAGQAVLMATARLIRAPLPIDLVGSLLSSQDQFVSRAAEAYLETDDSTVARKLILAHSGATARILGARQEFDPGHDTFGEFESWGERLRKEVLQPSGPEEIFALLSASYWGGSWQIVIRVRQGKTTLESYSEGRNATRMSLSETQIRKLRLFITDNKVDDLGPLNTTVHDGRQYEYLHITKAGGRRVFMNNPGISSTGGSVYDRLCGLLISLNSKPRS